MTSPHNVAEHLARRAADAPHDPALHIPLGAVRHHGHTPHRTITYAQLNAKADAYAAGLHSLGITRGTRTVLMVPPGEDFFTLTFALFKLAAIPVLIDPGMGIKNLGKCLAEAEPTAFIGIAKAHIARRLFRWGWKTIRTTVNVGKWRFFCDACTREFRVDPPPTGGGLSHTSSQSPPPVGGGVNADDPAAILFTSGSTGPAKGAEYTHGIFAAQVEMLKRTYGIKPGEVDFCTFPLFALFGPALGMACIVPDMDASRPATIDPQKASAQIAQFGATNLFGSPAVIRNLSTLADGSRLNTLKRVISAGAPANAEVLQRFTQMLPRGVQVYTPYGATEALPVANIGSDEILNETKAMTEQGKGVCIGRPVEGVTVKVIRISDEPIETWDESLVLPDGEIGEFVVRGPIVTKRYFHRDDATKLAKIVDPLTGETLHRMGDVGYYDEKGRLWFCGRKSHRVETKDGTLFTDMVEPVFNHAAKRYKGRIARTALIGVRHEGETVPVVVLEIGKLKSKEEFDEMFIHFLNVASKSKLTRSIHVFVPYIFDRFPVDVRHNSKIFREKIAEDVKLNIDWRAYAQRKP